MSKPFDFNQKRIEKILEDKDQAQAAFEQLMTDMQISHQAFDLIQHFCLKAFQLETTEELFILLDDFFLGELGMHWHMHVPQPRIKAQLSHRVSTYSDSMARKQLSHTVVDKQFEYDSLPDQSLAWLMGQPVMVKQIKILPFDSDLKQGFLALGMQPQAVELNSQAYGFLANAAKTLLERYLP